MCKGFRESKQSISPILLYHIWSLILQSLLSSAQALLPSKNCRWSCILHLYGPLPRQQMAQSRSGCSQAEPIRSWHHSQIDSKVLRAHFFQTLHLLSRCWTWLHFSISWEKVERKFQWPSVRRNDNRSTHIVRYIWMGPMKMVQRWWESHHEIKQVIFVFILRFIQRINEKSPAG